MLRRTLALVTTLSMLSGCSDLIGALGGGASVSGAVKAPSTQQAAIAFSGAYRLLATMAGETAVNAASVQAYSSSNATLGSAVQSGADGSFDIKGIPSGKTAILVATAKAQNGGSLKLSGLIKPSGISAVRDLNTASTVVAEKLRATLSPDKLDAVAQSDVDNLEGMVATSLDTADIPDLTQPTAAVTAFDTAKTKNPQIASTFRAIVGTQTASN